MTTNNDNPAGAPPPRLPLRFGTLCSGLGGAEVAWPDWTPVFCAEIDPFCRAVLAFHHPEVPNLGDITKIGQLPTVDVVVAGTPCQPFSIQGRRGGMADARGSLARAFLDLVGKSHPQYFVWENVPGVLSSGGGRDFGAFLGSVAELGYGWAYRCLDARYFGVPQRRRRVFVVGHRRAWQRAAAVLFDSPAGPAAGGAAREVRPRGLAAGGDAETVLLGWTGDETPKFGVDCCPTLRAAQGGEGVGIVSRTVFRRLSPEEWEILQGFPPGYTDLPDHALPGGRRSEKRRTFALGNAFCVPVLRWIGARIQEFH